MRSFLAFTILLASGTVSAATMDFNDLADGSAGHSLGYQGYLFESWTPNTSPIDDYPNGLDIISFTGSPALSCETGTTYLATYECDIEMKRSDGNLFSLNSVDYAALAFSPSNTSIHIVGYLANGGYVSTSNLLTPSSPYAMDSFIFDASWTNLESVRFRFDGSVEPGSALIVDNINVSAVPVPAAVWLFGSALAGLGWMRRKQTV